MKQMRGDYVDKLRQDLQTATAVAQKLNEDEATLDTANTLDI